MLDTDLEAEEYTMKVSELKSLSTKQLRDVVEKAEELIEERRADEIQEGRAKIAAMASDLGISIGELVGVQKKANGKTPSGRTPARPKYRSKADPSQQWSGKGRMASWLVEEMEESGKAKEHFLIKD